MAEMLKYRKKPVIVEAVQLDSGEEQDDASDQWCDVIAWVNANGGQARAIGWTTEDGSFAVIAIDTLEGTMEASPHDWIIREPFPTDDRRFYPCKPAIFDATYELVEVGE